MKPGLLIVDMLREYLDDEGKVLCKECRSIIPNISKLKDFCTDHEIPVFFVNTALKSDSVLAMKWGAHAMVGTKMAEVIDELHPNPNEFVVEKEGYNGFFRTNLEARLRENGVDTVLVTGIHTHVCVLLTAVGAFERGFNVITLSDCITTGYQPNHDTRLRFFVSHIGSLMTSQEWMESAK